jgi:hypothetical protein
MIFGLSHVLARPHKPLEEHGLPPGDFREDFECEERL